MKLFLQSFSKLIFTVIVLSVLLFLPAVTFAYAGGWRFIGLMCGMMCILGVLLLFFNPELLKKRLQAKEKQAEQKSVVLFSGLMFIAVFVLAGLDFRFGWSHMPMWLVFAGCVLLVLSYIGFAEVLRKYLFISNGRSATRATGGFFRVIRHCSPSYVYGHLVVVSEHAICSG